jgi:hypothetical protein
MTLTSFNISVPSYLEEGPYVTYWSLGGELSPPLYTPVKSTIIYVTKRRGITIQQDSILDLPLLGTSLLTEYTLDATPDTGL